MARQRIYRHDIRCPDCGSNWCAKYGKARGLQKYRCNDCQRYFTPDAVRTIYSESLKQQAVRMYCEGTSVSAICRVLELKVGTVYSWIKKSPVGEGGDAAAPPTTDNHGGSRSRSGDLVR